MVEAADGSVVRGLWCLVEVLFVDFVCNDDVRFYCWV